MTAIVTALREGVPAEDLRGMLEAAAAALEAAAGQDRARAAPTTLLLGPPTFKAETSTPVAAPLDAVMAQEVCCNPCTWTGQSGWGGTTMQRCISSSGSISLA